MPVITMSDREFNTTLAALRYWQRCGEFAGEDINDIATNGDTVAELEAEEIDSLCERINTPNPSDPLAKLAAEALDYRADQFDSSADRDLNVSGADLVDWFAAWRLRLRVALAAPEVAPAGLYAALKLALPLAESEVEDWSTGVEDGTYDNAAGCDAAVAAVEFARAVLDGTAKLPTVAVILEGGLVQGIVSDAPEIALAGIDGILVIDYDTEGADGDDVALVRQPDGSYSDAFVHGDSIGRAQIDLAQVDAEDRARDAAREAGWSYDRRMEAFSREAETAEGIATWADLCKAKGVEF